MLKIYFLCLVICLEAPESTSQRVLPYNFEGARVVFCKGSHYSWVVPGDCPKILVEGLPNPVAPTNAVAARASVHWFHLLRHRGKGLLEALDCCSRDSRSRLVDQHFVPSIPIALDLFLLENGAIEKGAAICGCCCYGVKMEAAYTDPPPLFIPWL